VICLISLGFKLYFVDFSSYPTGDSTSYLLNAISYKYGDFSAIPHKSPGWPLTISPFFYFVDSNNFLDYTNIARILSIIISVATIFPMYTLSRKFFPEKYSLVAASLLAFEPHLNFNASLGLSEPLFILIMIISFNFILNNNNKYAFLAFFFAGLLWIVRWNGAIMLLVLTIIYFINFNKSPKNFLKYLACLIIFFIVVSPMLIQRYETYGEPLYFNSANNFFMGSFSLIQQDMINRDIGEYSASDYINDNGFSQFINTFVFSGMSNLAEQLPRMMFPYLIIFLPIGIILSFRSFDQNSKYVRANWILILITLGITAIAFSVIPDRRHILFIFPFLIIFSIIPIQRLVEYGLSTFSFSKKQKNIFLILIIVAVIISSSLFMLRFSLPDIVLQNEQLKFSQFVNNNFSGKILDAGETLQGLRYVKITEPLGIFNTYRNANHVDPSLTVGKYYLVPIQGNYELSTIGIYANSIEELIVLGKKYDLTYISVNEKGSNERIYPYLNKIYENEKTYPFLIKVFDSNERGYEKFKVKIFKIDYEKYNSMNES